MVSWIGRLATGAAAATLLVAATGLADQAPASGGDDFPMPRYDQTGQLAFPAGYREWQFVTAGHGMSYNEQGSDGPALPFDNVFVQRGAYAAFKATGHWPEGTILVLEIRGGSQHGSINRHGAFQAGAPRAIEVHVRDTRFVGGWAFFSFAGGDAVPGPAAEIAHEAACYSCHEAHAAVDTTFVQFYPTLLPIAMEKGTLSRAYLDEATSTP